MHAWAGTVLRIARAKKGVSQRELAAAAAVPPSTIAKIESGHRQPTYPTLAKILASIDFGLTVQLVPLSQCHGMMLMDLQRERRARASDPQLPKDIDFSGTPAALTDAQLLYELSAALLFYARDAHDRIPALIDEAYGRAAMFLRHESLYRPDEAGDAEPGAESDPGFAPEDAVDCADLEPNQVAALAALIGELDRNHAMGAASLAVALMTRGVCMPGQPGAGQRNTYRERQREEEAKMPGTRGDSTSPVQLDALPMILAAAAFEHAANTATSWAEVNEQDVATEMFSKLAELWQMELMDPNHYTSQATLDAVTRIAQAYLFAAKTVQRTDPAPDLGHGDTRRRGLTCAANWLQTHADTFALIATQLADRLPQTAPTVRVHYQPSSRGDEFRDITFATLVVVQRRDIRVTVHATEPDAAAYFQQRYGGDDVKHRIDLHTNSVIVYDRTDTEFHDGDEVEFATLVAVSDGEIDVTVHGTDTDASLHRTERFPGVDLYRIDTHRVSVCEGDSGQRG